MRKSDGHLLFWSILLGFFMLMFVHAAETRRGLRSDLQLKKRYVRELGITDICLFTEARYTRHISVADRHAAFQDHPMSLEHFPTGSLIGPPAHLDRPGGTGEGGEDL